MAKFVITGVDGDLTGFMYDTLEDAVAAAKAIVKDEPDSDVEVMQVLKRVGSTLTVNVEDVT